MKGILENTDVSGSEGQHSKASLMALQVGLPAISVCEMAYQSLGKRKTYALLNPPSDISRALQLWRMQRKEGGTERSAKMRSRQRRTALRQFL